MKADALTIVVMVFALGVFVSSTSFISDSNADEFSAPSALQQGLVTGR